MPGYRSSRIGHWAQGHEARLVLSQPENFPALRFASTEMGFGPLTMGLALPGSQGDVARLRFHETN
jgi:hypothetical protein